MDNFGFHLISVFCFSSLKLTKEVCFSSLKLSCKEKASLNSY